MLAPGTRVGVYQVVSPLGAGGMGEVYRAYDTKLGREVAVKVVPSAFTSDADRLARLEREARVLASLNHPNVATVHGIEDVGGVRFIVMELVEGQTLAERLSAVRGGHGLPIPEVLSIAGQVADALDAAHEKGIVHRDLKPANIAITRDGCVKVLDFGLAKPLGGDASAVASDAVTFEQTADGRSSGLSPEQARGQRVDSRTDIWAFGCVLFEMLTGRRPLAGDNVTDVLVAQKALRFALTISEEVYAVQVLAEELETEDLQARWRERVEQPVRSQLGISPPQLVLIRSPYRQFFERFLAWLRDLVANRPDRQVIVLIPELVHRRWYQFIVSHRAMLQGGPHVSVMSTPWYPGLSPGKTPRPWATVRSRDLRAEDA